MHIYIYMCNISFSCHCLKEILYMYIIVIYSLHDLCCPTCLLAWFWHSPFGALQLVSTEEVYHQQGRGFEFQYDRHLSEVLPSMSCFLPIVSFYRACCRLCFTTEGFVSSHLFFVAPVLFVLFLWNISFCADYVQHNMLCSYFEEVLTICNNIMCSYCILFKTVLIIITIVIVILICLLLLLLPCCVNLWLLAAARWWAQEVRWPRWSCPTTGSNCKELNWNSSARPGASQVHAEVRSSSYDEMFREQLTYWWFIWPCLIGLYYQ